MMNKTELIKLYTIIHQLDNYFTKNEEYYNHDNPFFEFYESLNIPEIPVSLKKNELKEAIFIFFNGIAIALDYTKNTNPKYSQNYNGTEEPNIGKIDTIYPKTLEEISLILKTT
ncbi:MAG: UPF0058 family protein [Candidatus Aenigmarchaeota archaeon]|nr:UPF0058 family protein [Candidatus Aenigmarchaeota archaeon]